MEKRKIKTKIKTLGQLKKSYENIWTTSDLLEEPAYYEWIVSLLGNPNRKKLLDVGCGAGYFLEKANLRGFKTVGIDISSKAIEKSSKRTPRSELHVGVAEKLPFKNNSFDAVVCLGSLEHFLDMRKSLSEMYRVARDKGKICIVLPNKWAIDIILNGITKGQDPDHGQELERFFSYDEAARILRDNRFTVEKVYGYNRPCPNDLTTGTRFSTGINLLYKQVYKFIRWKIPVRMSYVFVFILKKRIS